MRTDTCTTIIHHHLAAAPGPVPGWKNERISSACGTQISSEAIYAPGVRQQAAETSADLSSIGLADDRLNRIVQIYGLTPLMRNIPASNGRSASRLFRGTFDAPNDDQPGGVGSAVVRTAAVSLGGTFWRRCIKRPMERASSGFLTHFRRGWCHTPCLLFNQSF